MRFLNPLFVADERVHELLRQSISTICSDRLSTIASGGTVSTCDVLS